MVFERMSEDCISALMTAQRESRKLGLTEVGNEVMLVGIVGFLVIALVVQTWMVNRAAARSVTAAGDLLRIQREDNRKDVYETWRRAEEEKVALMKQTERAYAELRKTKVVAASGAPAQDEIDFDTPRRRAPSPLRPPQAPNGVRPGAGADSPVAGV